MTTVTTAERFTPWTDCPNCGLWDLHGLHKPEPFDRHSAVDRALNDIDFLSNMWHALKMTRSEQAGYEVIRTCRCGQQWGQEPVS